MTTAQFIVYELLDPRTNLPFYVGKGHPNRPNAHVMSAVRWISSGRPVDGKWHNRNLKKLNVISEILGAGLVPLTQVIATFTTNEQAAAAERARIEVIGLENLTNQPPGGSRKVAAATGTSSRARLNYSLDEQTAQALHDYCESTGRKAAEVARQTILDYLDAEVAHDRCITHPSDKRADLWLQPASMSAFDQRVEREGHISRSALICALLANFLNSRPMPKQMAVTINVPIELWNQLGGDPEAAIIRAIEASLTKECV